jgi:hypothetical protein
MVQVWLLDRRQAKRGTSTQPRAVEDSNIGNLGPLVPKGHNLSQILSPNLEPARPHLAQKAAVDD